MFLLLVVLFVPHCVGEGISFAVQLSQDGPSADEIALRYSLANKGQVSI